MNQRSTTHEAEGLENQKVNRTSSGLRPPSDSGIPMASALGGPSPAANSFRQFPTGSSPQSGEGNSVPQLDDEQLVLDTIMQALRGLKMGGRPLVSQIARDWERIFNYRIQVTMQERQKRAKARMVRMHVPATLAANESDGKITSSPSGVHIRLDVSPGQD